MKKLDYADPAIKYLVAGTFVAVLIVTFVCLFHGIQEVHVHIYYIPIILAAYFYRRKGVYIATMLAAIYLLMVAAFTSADWTATGYAFIRAIVFIGVAYIVYIIAEMLYDEREVFRTTFNNSKAGMMILSSDMNVREINPEMQRISGYGNEERLSINDFFGPAEIETIKKCICPGSVGIGHFGFQMKMLTKSGEVREALISTAGLPEKDMIVLIIMDVSEWVRAEKQLKTSEKMFRSVFEESPLGMEIYDHEGKLTRINRKCADIFGLVNTSEVIGLDLFEDPNISDEMKERLINCQIVHYDTIFDFGKVKEKNLYRTNRSGEIFIELVITPLVTEGRINGYIMQISDITDRKNAEEALKESEEKFRGVAERSSDIIMLTDTEGKTTYVSPSVKKILGYEPEEMLETTADQFVHPEDLEAAYESIRKNSAGESVEETLYRIEKKNGEYATMEMSVSSITKNGEFMGIQVMGRDISEKIAARKRIEKLLRKQEEQLFIINNSPAVAFLWKAEENWPVEMVSDNITHFGYTPDDFLSGRIVYRNIIHPDDQEHVSGEVEYNSENHIDEYSQTYRIFGKDGNEYWIEDFTRIRRDENGEITHYQGIVLDITDRKEAETDLLSYIREAALRIRNPIEMVSQFLDDAIREIQEGALDKQIDKEQLVTMLTVQLNNLRCTIKNICELDSSIAEKRREIPEEFRKFFKR